MSPDVQSAIEQAATDGGVDPAFALAVADRESGGDPNASASRTIHGLFQMSRPLRSQYGIGDSNDPATQAKGWTSFAGDLKTGLAKQIGRDPTNPEIYLGHYFGQGRAARIISGQVAPSTDVRDVFTPQELQGNPEFARAGTVGSLVNSIESDITRREAKFGGNGGGSSPAQTGSPDFASLGVTADGKTASPQPVLTSKSTSQPDFAAFGAASNVAPPGAGVAPSEDVPAPAQDNAETMPPDEEPAGGLLQAETPASIGRQHMMMQAMGMGPGPVGGIAGVPGQQPQTAAPVQSRPIAQPNLPVNAALTQQPGAPQEQGQPNGQA